MPKNDQIWPKIGIFGQFGPGHAGFLGALLVGRLVVVARGLYLARHLFTLYTFLSRCYKLSLSTVAENSFVKRNVEIIHICSYQCLLLILSSCHFFTKISFPCCFFLHLKRKVDKHLQMIHICSCAISFTFDKVAPYKKQIEK